jgi:hypothetical protein
MNFTSENHLITEKESINPISGYSKPYIILPLAIPYIYHILPILEIGPRQGDRDR